MSSMAHPQQCRNSGDEKRSAPCRPERRARVLPLDEDGAAAALQGFLLVVVAVAEVRLVASRHGASVNTG